MSHGISRKSYGEFYMNFPDAMRAVLKGAQVQGLTGDWHFFLSKFDNSVHIFSFDEYRPVKIQRIGPLVISERGLNERYRRVEALDKEHLFFEKPKERSK